MAVVVFKLFHGASLDTLVSRSGEVCPEPFIYHEACVMSSSQLYIDLEWSENGTCWCIALLADGLLEWTSLSPFSRIPEGGV